MSTAKTVSRMLVVALLGYCGVASARFIQADPIGLAGGINTYAYVDSDPLNFVDPDGATKQRGGPNQPYPNQVIATATANSLINQIRQYQPSFTYAIASNPGQTQYTPQQIFYLRDVLLRLRQTVPPPNFVVTSSGMCMPVPQSSGLVPNVNPSGAITGQTFTGGTGGGVGLAPSVTQLRLMNPNQFNPTGYGVYMNTMAQGVNPYTGQTLPNTAPMRHIPF